MAFDENKFLNAKYRDRTADVQVPELKKYFAGNEDPVWVVRCLTAEEIARSNDEVSKNLDISAIVSALVSQGSKDKADAVKDLVGLSKDTVPGDIVKRISHLVYGSVSPECSRELAVKLGRDHSVLFFKLTNKILELSGRGRLGE